jgi:hypothetical protein
VPIVRNQSYEGFEAEIVRTASQELVCLIRRSQKATGLRVVSRDLGVTRGTAEEVPVGHALGLLLDGGQLLVNHRANPERMGKPAQGSMGTVLSLSLDGGKTFVSSVLLDTKGAVGNHTYGGIVKLGAGGPATYFTSSYSTPKSYPTVRGKPGRVCCVYGRFFR